MKSRDFLKDDADCLARRPDCLDCRFCDPVDERRLRVVGAPLDEGDLNQWHDDFIR